MPDHPDPSPRLAVFSWSIYPRPGGSSYVIEQLARAFDSEEMIVLGGRRLFERDAEKARNRTIRFHYLASELNICGRGDRFFWLVRWLSFPYLFMKARRLCREYGATHVLGVFPDEYYLLMALKVADHLGCGFSSYFHNTYIENVSGQRRLGAKAIQESVFARSCRIFMMSDGLCDYYRKVYPQLEPKLSVLRHSFSKWPSTDDLRPRVAGAPKTLLFIGNFNHTNMDATCRVVTALAGSGYRLCFCTPVPAILLKARGLPIEHVDSIEYLREAEFQNKLTQADVLVLTHGFDGAEADIEYKTMFPTRLLTMLLASRPILVHAPLDTFLASFVRKHGCAVLVNKANKDEIRSAIAMILSDSDYAQRLVQRAKKTCELFHVSLVREELLRSFA